jgi:hypothetical protein
MASLGLTNISGTAETAIYNGGSLWADYWIETITELRGDLISSGKLDEALIDRFLAAPILTDGPRRLLSPQCTALRAVHKPQRRL